MKYSLKTVVSPATRPPPQANPTCCCDYAVAAAAATNATNATNVATQVPVDSTRSPGHPARWFPQGGRGCGR